MIGSIPILDRWVESAKRARDGIWVGDEWPCDVLSHPIMRVKNMTEEEAASTKKEPQTNQVCFSGGAVMDV